jgi:hypothetical protein
MKTTSLAFLVLRRLNDARSVRDAFVFGLCTDRPWSQFEAWRQARQPELAEVAERDNSCLAGETIKKRRA